MADKVAQRREAKIASIVDAAWKLAREHGIAGVSLHALAREVGMRQPSLYEYFDSKNALDDAMFADGNRQLLDRLEQLTYPLTRELPRRNRWARLSPSPSRTQHATNCSSYRHVPGFVPSPESYALADDVPVSRRQGAERSRRHPTGRQHRLPRRHRCRSDSRPSSATIQAATAGAVTSTVNTQLNQVD